VEETVNIEGIVNVAEMVVIKGWFNARDIKDTNEKCLMRRAFINKC
jgi:hypothetical protein